MVGSRGDARRTARGSPRSSGAAALREIRASPAAPNLTPASDDLRSPTAWAATLPQSRGSERDLTGAVVFVVRVAQRPVWRPVCAPLGTNGHKPGAETPERPSPSTLAAAHLERGDRPRRTWSGPPTSCVPSLEPPYSVVRSRRSRIKTRIFAGASPVEPTGIEPVTSCLQIEPCANLDRSILWS